jgi:hypothetical protein
MLTPGGRNWRLIYPHSKCGLKLTEQLLRVYKDGISLRTYWELHPWISLGTNKELYQPIEEDPAVSHSLGRPLTVG